MATFNKDVITRGFGGGSGGVNGRQAANPTNVTA